MSFSGPSQPSAYDPTIESMTADQVASFRYLSVSHDEEEWFLSFEDRPRTFRATRSLGRREASPEPEEILAILDSLGLVFGDEDWSPWRGVAPNESRFIGVTTPAQLDVTRAEAAASQPQIGVAEKAWAKSLSIIGTMTMIAAAVGLSGMSYYFMRFLICSISIALIVLLNRRRDYWPVLPLIWMAGIWNPFFASNTTRAVWVPVDLIAAGAFIALFIWLRRKKKLADPFRGWIK